MNTLPPACWSTQWLGMEISVFATGDDSPQSLADAAAVLNDEEKSRAARFHFAADRERWMRSRALLRRTLSVRLGTDPSGLQFITAANGKPALMQKAFGMIGSADESAEGNLRIPLEFNLSHSGSFAAIAVSTEPVGVDIEAWKEDLPVADLAAHEFRKDESAAIGNSSEPHLLFYRLWTAKEAVMKCTGLGLSLPPASIQIHGDPGFGNCTALRLDVQEAFDVLIHDIPGVWALSASRRAE